MCIGPSFATLALKVSVAMLLQRFRLAIAGGTRIDPAVSVTMRPAAPLPAVLHPPDRAFARVPVTGGIRELVDLDAPEAPATGT